MMYIRTDKHVYLYSVLSYVSTSCGTASTYIASSALKEPAFLTSGSTASNETTFHIDSLQVNPSYFHLLTELV